MNNILHNITENRFEIHVGNQIAYVEYEMVSQLIRIMHTRVPKELEGQGIAAQLTKEVLDYAKNNNLKVDPICSYAKLYIERHPETQVLL